MMIDTKNAQRLADPAVKAAGLRLEQWARRTYYAAAVSAACLVVIAALALAGAVEYLKFKGAVADGVKKAEQTARAFPPRR